MCALLALGLALTAGPAAAVPDLQLYIPGATWDDATETWITTASEFDLQVIGANSTIWDVKVAAALVPNTTPPGGGTITMTAPGAGSQTAFGYGYPIMGDGDSLPGHGIYPTWFTSLPIGDIVITGSSGTVYDMQPGETGSAQGEIKTVHVVITGFTAVHFDAYDHTIAGHTHVKYTFAPFSHDGGTGVPEPGTLLMLAPALAGMWGLRLRCRKGRANGSR